MPNGAGILLAAERKTEANLGGRVVGRLALSLNSNIPGQTRVLEIR